MIAKVSSKMGRSTVGLAGYLFGSGRSNEHTDQRLIAGSETLGIADGTRLNYADDRSEVIALGRELDSHRKAMGIEFGKGQGHVWHCSIAVPAGEHLTDAQWAEVARDAVAKFGFDDGVQAPCRWIAVHHGRSVGGNEHIHLAVNLVREDGRIAETRNDYRKASELCAEFESRYGLSVVEGRKDGGMPGLSHVELKRDFPERERLALLVRSAAAAAENEAEFVQHLRRYGVLVRPRYVEGGRTEVVGYSVAIRPTRNTDKALWFGGRKLARDLSLNELRKSWVRTSEDLSVWSQRTVPRHASYKAESWKQAGQFLSEVQKRLAEVPVDDHEAWKAIAGECSGMLSALSARLEGDRPGPLAAAARSLAHAAQTRRGEPRARRKDIPYLKGIAQMAAHAAAEGPGATGQVFLLRQVIQLIDVIAQVQRARGKTQRATELATHSRALLEQVTAGQRTPTTAVPPQKAPRRPVSTPEVAI